MVGAAQAAVLVPAEELRRAAVHAQRPEEPDFPLGVAERDQILTEEPHASRPDPDIVETAAPRERPRGRAPIEKLPLTRSARV